MLSYAFFSLIYRAFWLRDVPWTLLPNTVRAIIFCVNTCNCGTYVFFILFGLLMYLSLCYHCTMMNKVVYKELVLWWSRVALSTVPMSLNFINMLMLPVVHLWSGNFVINCLTLHFFNWYKFVIIILSSSLKTMFTNNAVTLWRLRCRVLGANTWLSE